MTELPYRPNVCLLILNQKNLLFLGERLSNPGCWQFPQGGVEPEYSLADNAIREAMEELGADQQYFTIIKQLELKHSYDFSKPPDYAVDKWRGQTQTFWVLRFTGTDSDISLAKYHQELSDYKWCTVEQALRLAEPKRVVSYQKAIAEMQQLGLVG